MIKIDYSFISPNFGERPKDVEIDTIIIHYTEMSDALSAINRLCDPIAEVSSHYLIDKQGKIFSLVPNHLRAWHAGPSSWRGKDKANDYSIGIELDNNGREEFSPKLMDSLIKLCHELISQYPIKQRNIIGHSDVIPPRKFDPGRLFNWSLLAENNIGIFPKVNSPEKIQDILSIQKGLAYYGYKIELTGVLDEQTKAVMRAFNEHFNPKCFEDWNEFSQAILNALVTL